MNEPIRKRPDLDLVMQKLYDYADQNYDGDLLTHALPAFNSLEMPEKRVFIRSAMMYHIRRHEEQYYKDEMMDPATSRPSRPPTPQKPTQRVRSQKNNDTVPTTDMIDYNQKSQIELRSWMAKVLLVLGGLLLTVMFVFTLYVPGKDEDVGNVLDGVTDLLGEIVK